MSELKPCPLCGGDDVVLSQVTSSGGWGVLCRGCHVYQDTRAEYSDDAVFAWNRRPDAPSAGEVAADVAIVRAVLHAHQRAMTPPDSGWGDMSYAKGSYDHLPQFQAALKAFRAALPAPPQADGGE